METQTTGKPPFQIKIKIQFLIDSRMIFFVDQGVAGRAPRV